MNSVIEQPRRADRRLQKVASGMARNRYRGHFGNAASFELIALETRRDSR